MELGLDQKNIKSFLWHLGVVGVTAILLEVLNYTQTANLDPHTVAFFAVASPVIKLIVEMLRKS